MLYCALPRCVVNVLTVGLYRGLYSKKVKLAEIVCIVSPVFSDTAGVMMIQFRLLMAHVNNNGNNIQL